MLVWSSHRNQFELNFDPRIKQVHSDPIRIKQVLHNLLSNAAKFTEEGKISLSVSLYQHKQQDWIRFTISDDGIGIPAHKLKKLFQPFTQLDNSNTRQHNGTGLGLVISLRFCQLMGGDIQVDSLPDEGSRFSFSLPVHWEAPTLAENINIIDDSG